MKRERLFGRSRTILFLGLILMMLFAMTGTAMAYETFTQGTDTKVTKGFTYQCYTSQYAVRKFSIDSKYSKIASVTEAGVLTAKATGTFVLTESVNYGTTPSVKNYTVSVVKNVYTGPAYKKLSVRSYSYGQVSLELLSAKFSGKNVVLNCAALNNRLFRAVKFNKITIWLEMDGKTIVKKTFKNRAINLKAYKKKKMTFKIPISNAKKKQLNLASSKFNCEYSYKYTYQY